MTVWDVRVVSHPDPAMLADAGRHALVVTVEDGIRYGGARDVPGRRPAARLPARRRRPRSSRSGIPRSFIAQGKPDRILSRLGLDGLGTVRNRRIAVGPGRWRPTRWAPLAEARGGRRPILDAAGVRPLAGSRPRLVAALIRNVFY